MFTQACPKSSNSLVKVSAPTIPLADAAQEEMRNWKKIPRSREVGKSFISSMKTFHFSSLRCCDIVQSETSLINLVFRRRNQLRWRIFSGAFDEWNLLIETNKFCQKLTKFLLRRRSFWKSSSIDIIRTQSFRQQIFLWVNLGQLY